MNELKPRNQRIAMAAPPTTATTWTSPPQPTPSLFRGIDFTSRPTAQKPIVCVECWLIDNVLRPIDGNPWHYFQDFNEFEMFLSAPSPTGLQWIAGVDFPIVYPSGSSKTWIGLGTG